MYLRECQGVDLRRLPAAAKLGSGPVTAEFYDQLFAAIQARGQSAPEWIASKQTLGRDIAARILQPWKERHGRAPRILATGAGEAWAECTWLEAGFAVTIHDGTSAYFEAIQARQPQASFLQSDMASFTPEQTFDVISMLANDFVLDRAGFVDFCRRMAAALSPGGMIICYCPSVLSLRRILIEALRRATGYYRRNQWIFWGWWRSPGEFQRVSRAAGLQLTNAFKPSNGGWAAQSLTLPSWKENNGIFLFEKAI